MTSCTSVTVGKIRSEFEYDAMVLSRQATFQHQKAANLQVIAVPLPVLRIESNSYRRKGNKIQAFSLKRNNLFRNSTYAPCVPHDGNVGESVYFSSMQWTGNAAVIRQNYGLQRPAHQRKPTVRKFNVAIGLLIAKDVSLT